MRRIITIILIFLFTPISLQASTGPGSGELRLMDKQGNVTFSALMLDAEADIQVTAMTARVSLKQTFKNTENQWVDGVYVFPLPDDAAVRDLTLTVGERIIRGVVKERQQAKRDFIKARAEGKRAALLESERPNLFTLSLANIEPGATVIAEITYLQTVAWRDGVFSLRLPTTLTPRFIPGRTPRREPAEENADQSLSLGNGWTTDARRITPPQTRSAASAISIRATLRPGIDLSNIASPSHHIQWREEQGVWNVELATGSTPMNRDFVLQWTTAPESEPKAALFAEDDDAGRYYTLMLAPPVAAAVNPAPRELVFIIDSSGSMAGESMRQAKSSLIAALDQLGSQDRFNIIDFDDEARPLFPSPVAVDAHRIDLARHFVALLDADGGTEMAPAIELALAGSPPEGFLRQVVFITDGAVGNEAALFALINKKLRRARLFTVGIGAAPNRWFMRKAAEAGRGSFTQIDDISQVRERMSRLFARLESPALRDIRVQWPDASADTFPRPIPDLYLGEPLIVTTRGKALAGDIVITGQLNGQPWRKVLHQSGGADSTPNNSGLATIWARAKVEHLMDKLTLGAPTETIKPEVIDLALKHNLVTRYTSFVAIDQTPVRPAGEPARPAKVPSLMPAGNTMNIPYPATATSAELSFWAGVGLLMLGVGFQWFTRRLP